LLLWRTRFSKIGKRIALAGILLLLIAGASPLGTALLLPLENRFPRWDSSRGPPTGLIVLGGVIDPEISVKRGEISLGEAAERIIAAVELYHRYPTVRIVFRRKRKCRGPARIEFAIRFWRILIFRVTHRAKVDLVIPENAVNTIQLVRPKPGERWLLITSAYRLPRAIGLFRQAGFPVEATLSLANRRLGRPLDDVIFILGGLLPLNQAAHEWVAAQYDRLNGRTAVLFLGHEISSDGFTPLMVFALIWGPITCHLREKRTENLSGVAICLPPPQRLERRNQLARPARQ
jgi:uncharacterized SAM-binding protein YcdF (DUF218 family)